MIPGMWTAERLTGLRKKADLKKKRLDFSIFSPKTTKECDFICDSVITDEKLSQKDAQAMMYFPTERTINSVSRVKVDLQNLSGSTKDVIVKRRPSKTLRDSSLALKPSNSTSMRGTPEFISIFISR